MPQVKTMSMSVAWIPADISARILAMPAISALWASSVGMAMEPAVGIVLAPADESGFVSSIAVFAPFVQMAGSGAISYFSCARAALDIRASEAANKYRS